MSVFDQYVDRSGPALFLKDVLTPDSLRAKGLRGYCGAEFEFPTCPAFSEGAAAAAAAGLFGFTLPGDRYLDAVVRWMKRVRALEISPEWIVPTHGTIFSLATLIRMVTKPGENIMILTPGYNRYEQAATRLGRGTVRLPLAESEGRYTADLPLIEKAFSDSRNRLLVLTQPGNPTGHVFPAETLRQIDRLSRKYGVYIFSDEIFGEITFGDPVPSFASLNSPYAVTCTGMGKLFSLTGVNHANVLIPDGALRERYTLQRNADHYGSLDPVIGSGLIAAFTPAGEAWLEELKAYLTGNIRFILESLREIFPALHPVFPDGTYVLWIDYTPLGLSDEQLRTLLDGGLFPGDLGSEYYADDQHVRYSVACPRAQLETSMKALKIAKERVLK